MRGFPDREAVVLGLAQTGGVITAAGIIMAVAFLGTMVAPQPVLNQLSFFIIIAVLTDTFIVRAMLVPAMMVRTPLILCACVLRCSSWVERGTLIAWWSSSVFPFA